MIFNVIYNGAWINVNERLPKHFDIREVNFINVKKSSYRRTKAFLTLSNKWFIIDSFERLMIDLNNDELVATHWYLNMCEMTRGKRYE